METAEEYRIRRIEELLRRLEEIPRELDRITHRLFRGNMNTREFAQLVDRRNNLLVEKMKVENDLKNHYHMKI